MIDPTRILLYVFGLITIVGGVQGYVVKQSIPSIVAGSICGLLLIVGGWLLQTGKISQGAILGLVISIVIAIQFAPKFFKGGGLWPAGVETLLAIAAIVLTGLLLRK